MKHINSLYSGGMVERYTKPYLYMDRLKIAMRYKYSMYYTTSMPAQMQALIRLQANSLYGLMITPIDQQYKNIKFDLLKSMIRYRLKNRYHKEI